MSGFAEGLIGAVTGGFKGLAENADDTIKAQAQALATQRAQALVTLKAAYESATQNQIADKRQVGAEKIAQGNNAAQIRAAEIAAGAKRYGDDLDFLKSKGQGGNGAGGVASPETARYLEPARASIEKMVEMMAGPKPERDPETGAVNPAAQQRYQAALTKATQYKNAAMEQINKLLPQLVQNNVIPDEGGAIAWNLATGQGRHNVGPLPGNKFSRVISASNGAKLLLDPAGNYKPSANELADVATQYPQLFRDNSSRR